MKRLILGISAVALTACAQAPPPGFSAANDFGGGWMLYPPLSGQVAERAMCPPTGWDRDKLVTLKAAKFEIADDAARQAFVKAITACLANPDPTVRDGIAYEALTHMLRGKQLTVETMRALKADLVARFDAPAGAGFEQPFAALALSEVARADRIEPFLTEDELIELLVDAQHWFINIRDYRGFDAHEGWRHGVAHGADLLMQLALNSRIDPEGLRVIVSAVGAQVAPKMHSYIDGESERLARPILFAAARGAMEEAKWTEWFAALATPPEGIEPYGEAWLAWRHNTAAFLQTLYVNVTLGTDAAHDVMRSGLEAALKAMP